MPEIRRGVRRIPTQLIASGGYNADQGSEWRSRRWDIRLLGALLLVMLISTIICHNRFWLPAVEGFNAHVAERVSRGEVLHRDALELYAGYANLANAAAFSLFVVRMVSMRFPLAVLTVIQAALMFLLLRGHRCGRRCGAYLAWFRSISLNRLLTGTSCSSQS
jgi:hypothetical protein